jgi:heme oxygenase
MQPTMIETPALSLPQRLKAATAEEHRRVERSGVMATLLRGHIERVAYLALLRNLHALYAALEPALLRHAAHPVVGPAVMPELFRREALERDLQALHDPADPLPAPLQPATAAYVERLFELDATRPELLVAHAYVRYLGDLSGGQQLRRLVGRALGLEGAAGTRFYDFGDGARASALALRFRAALDEVGARARDADAIVAEAESAFVRHGLLFEQLAAAA